MMKPKTMMQKVVYDLHAKLPPLTPAQVKWAVITCPEHIAKRSSSKGVCHCLECGNSWREDKQQQRKKYITCPTCGMKLKVDDSKKRSFCEEQYLCYATTFKGWQVLRYFCLKHTSRQGSPSNTSLSEMVQHWLNETGDLVTMSIPVMPYSWAQNWCFGGHMEVRRNSFKYDLMVSNIYPNSRVLPVLRRNGFSGKWFTNTPVRLVYGLLTDPRVETIMKSGQHQLLSYVLNYGDYYLDKVWPSVRVCIRHNYAIDHPDLWCDLIILLSSLGKDTRNPKYICPKDVKSSHDKHLEARRKANDREWNRRREQDRIRRLAEEDKVFKESKSKYTGLSFGNGRIQVQSLDSVAEYMLEGDAMHHCVYLSEYHLKPDSLVLSARMDGRRLETIEVSLRTMGVVQSRGEWNKPTEYHEEIVQLVRNNIPLIRERYIS